MALPGLTIGQAATQAGPSRKGVLVYEAHGLLSAAPRNAAGYRLYTGDDVRMRVFIRRARALGLRLEEIGEVLAAQADGTPPRPVRRRRRGPGRGRVPDHRERGLTSSRRA